MVSKAWTWLTAAALLFAGVTNVHAHIHYCFDGQAVPAAVHLVGGGDHEHGLASHDHGPDGHDAGGHSDRPDGDHRDGTTGHDDVDIDVPNPAIAKVVKLDMPALAPTLSWAAVLEPARTTALTEAASLPSAPSPPHSRPQPRGPPR